MGRENSTGRTGIMRPLLFLVPSFFFLQHVYHHLTYYIYFLPSPLLSSTQQHINSMRARIFFQNLFCSLCIPRGWNSAREYQSHSKCWMNELNEYYIGWSGQASLTAEQRYDKRGSMPHGCLEEHCSRQTGQCGQS